MSHNSDSSILPPVPGQVEFVEKWLTGSQRKTAFALRRNCEEMIAGHSRRRLVELDLGGDKKQKVWLSDKPENLNCTGFLTLTVGDKIDGRFQQVFDSKEASRRINNLARRVLADLFERAIIVTERHKNRAIHFHIIGILRGRPDIRTGFDFAEFTRLRGKGTRFAAADVGASPELAALWKRLRAVLPGYGFGRAELTPVRKTSEAVACYVSKYIEKNVCNRLPDDKRKKLVRYLGWEKEQLKPNDFSWATERAMCWRGKARELASLVQVYDRERWAEVAGPRWAFFVTRWMHSAGDTLTPFLVMGWAERETMRGEVAAHIGRAAAEKIDGERLRFAEAMTDLRAAQAAGTWKPKAPEQKISAPMARWLEKNGLTAAAVWN